MSGSGGGVSGGRGTGGVGGGGAGGSGGMIDCELLTIKSTVLASPVPDVIKKLKPDDVLRIDATSPKGPAIAITSKGEKAGSITSTLLARLLQCIDDGYEYVAVVKTVNRGACEVEIRPKGK